MNTPSRRGPLEHLALQVNGFVADWRDFVFLHFAVPPAELAPHVPHPLDLVDGRAFVSLVSFDLARLRPARGFPPALGRLLLRPISNHQFLNLRTYVRGPAGPGIHFLAEWVNNALAARIGPLAYGLPYRLAAMERVAIRGAGLRRIALHDKTLDAGASLVVPLKADAPASEASHDSPGDFLLERYRAYCTTRGKSRWFEVAHARWRAAPFQLARLNARLFEELYPWFKYATFAGGHLAPGFPDVVMSAPRAVAATAAAPFAREARGEVAPSPRGAL